jgi:hypothetical protein
VNLGAFDHGDECPALMFLLTKLLFDGNRL